MGRKGKTMKYTRMAEIGALELKRKIKLPIEIGIEERKPTCQLIIEIPAQKYVIDEMSTYVDAVWVEGGYTGKERR